MAGRRSFCKLDGCDFPSWMPFNLFRCISVESSAQQRLLDVTTEVEKVIDLIKEQKRFFLGTQAHDDVEQFINLASRVLPSQRSDPSYEIRRQGLRQLLKIEADLKVETDIIRRSLDHKLHPATLENVRRAMDRLRHVQLMTLSPTDFQAAEKREPPEVDPIVGSKRLKQGIAKIELDSEIELASKMKQTEEHGALLKTVLDRYEQLYISHRTRLSMDHLSSMIRASVLIADKMKRLEALANSHGMFVSLTLAEMTRMIPGSNPKALHDVFWSLSLFGPKLKKLAAFGKELKALISALIDQSILVAYDMNSNQINTCLRSLYAMRVTSGVPLLRCFARRLETEHEQFSLPQKILMISALTDLNYRVTKEMENILRSPQFSFGKLYPFQISRLLCSFGRMNQTSFADHMPKIVRRIKKTCRNFTSSDASHSLRGFSMMMFHPGERTLDVLIEQILYDRERGQRDRFVSMAVPALLHLITMDYCSESLIQALKQDFMVQSRSYEWTQLCSLLLALCLFGKLDDAILETAKEALATREKDLKEPLLLTKLAQIHVYCLSHESKSPFSEAQVEAAMQHLRATKIDRRYRPQLLAELTDYLQQLGFSFKGYETRDDLGMAMQVYEKLEKRYALEILPFNRYYGQKPVLFISQRWREQILAGLKFGIIRIHEAIWNERNSHEAKLAYLLEMTSDPGQPSPLLPHELIEQIRTAWKEPDTDDDDDFSDPHNTFDEGFMERDESYENDTETSKEKASESEVE